MPAERHPISVSQLSELLGVDPARFIAVERCDPRQGGGWCVVTESQSDSQAIAEFIKQIQDIDKYLQGQGHGEETAMQMTGTFPEAHDNTKRGPKKGAKKR